VVGRIACPTLILHGERDHFISPQQASAFYAALNCPKTLRMFNADDGAEEHCQIGNLSRMHQVAFDWLDEVFEVAGRSGSPRVDPLVARATSMLEVVQP